MLYPAISSTAWDTGISTRIVIFRDWLFRASDAASRQEEYIPGVRLAGVMKAKGISYEGFGKVVTFAIEKVSRLGCRVIAFLKGIGWSPGGCSGSDRDQNKRIARLASYIIEA